LQEYPVPAASDFGGHPAKRQSEILGFRRDSHRQPPARPVTDQTAQRLRDGGLGKRLAVVDQQQVRTS
jgi:hypothetical protein